MLTEYLWCIVVGALFCFTLGFGMGANDVANNFGTSVGAKSISLRKALIIAAIFELVGSVGLGASVTDSIRKGVFSADAFGDMPDFMLVANLAALVTGTIWLFAASTIGMSVSTTHSLVGALLGCGLAVGHKAVNWGYIGRLLIGWLVGPMSACVIGAIYFVTLRRFVLRSPNAVRRGQFCLAPLLFVFGCCCALFFTFSNPMVLSNKTCSINVEGKWVDATPCNVEDWTKSRPGISVGIAIGCGAVLAAVIYPIVYFWSKKKLDRFTEAQAAERAPAGSATSIAIPQSRSSGASSLISEMLYDTDEESPKGCKGRTRDMWDNAPWNQDLHAEVYEEKEKANELMELAEKFDTRCEVYFGALQTLSAALACLVHGSNDVSNAAAPFASVYSIYKEGRFLTEVSVPVWILFLGGSAISVGLMVLGYRVIKRVGIELLYVSASRGFCVEMALSTVMLTASFLGQSISTTHVMIGAMIGVGLMDKQVDPATGADITRWTLGFLNFHSVNWKLASKFVFSWILTLVLCAIAGWLIFSFAIYSPTKIDRFTPCHIVDGYCVDV